MPVLEFHCHTIYSKDSLTRPVDLVRVAREKGIDRLVVTDHNRIGGALEAQKLDPERVIVGEEILTTQGELLAAFVKEEIPARLTPLETIRRLREQGAFISVSHPFDGHRGWELADLLEIVPLIDAIEVFNARCFSEIYNQRAADFAREHNLLATVGSDAHTTRELGRAVSVLEKDFHNAETLKSALENAGARTRLSSPLIRFSSRWAVTVKKLGWVQHP
jgi:predicted metal-dependent phosphoesterase TrpH